MADRSMYNQQPGRKERYELDPTTGQFVLVDSYPQQEQQQMLSSLVAPVDTRTASQQADIRRTIDPETGESRLEPYNYNRPVQYAANDGNNIAALMKKVSAMTMPGYSEAHPDMAYSSRSYAQGVPDIASRPEYKQLQALLALQKPYAETQKLESEAKKAQRELTGKSESTYDKELAKRLAEADASKLMAKTPGTPEYERIQKEAKAAQAGAAREQSAIEKADVMIGKAEKALGKLGFFTTGLPGQILSNIGGTEARDLAKTVDTIKANIGFAELQKMRQESPTGGALGQVAVKELDFLQSAIENLDTAQSQEQLAENLKGVITHYNNFKKIKASAPQGADGGSTATPTSVTLPNGRTMRFPSGAAAEAFKREAGIQ